MNVFIGWWHETGLASFKCAKCSPAVSALHPPNAAIPCPKGFLTLPSWWTSERKAKTVCAIHFRSVGPSFP
ncbi:hypothetical protein CN070_00940 [Sinorhizobium meliloti]|nr:hypothetical protein CN070_00940 [Sinorhizobium meliloti]